MGNRGDGEWIAATQGKRRRNRKNKNKTLEARPTMRGALRASRPECKPYDGVVTVAFVEKKEESQKRIKRPTLRHRKQALRNMGHLPPYLGELTQAELAAWEGRYLSGDQRDAVWGEALRIFEES